MRVSASSARRWAADIRRLSFSLAALNAGKHVVTKQGACRKARRRASEAAEKNNAAYLYEAAVGGGIPVLRSMKTSLASDRIPRRSREY